MSQRYGRKRRKAHLITIEELERVRRSLDEQLHRAQRNVHDLRQRLASFNGMLIGIANEARASVMAQTASAIKHAESELLRRGLEEMRQVGMSNMEFAVIHGREDAPVALTTMRISFRPPEISFVMLVQPVTGANQPEAGQ